MRLEVLLSKLNGIRRNGDGWMTLCPAHPDRNPSLSVRGRRGKILMHCFRGCSVESICAALRIKVRDLFSAPQGAVRRQPEIVRAIEHRIAEVRSRLTPQDKERPVTVVLADPKHPDFGFARALALAVEGELVQVFLAKVQP